MNPKVSGILIGIIVAACFATGAIVLPHLPPMLASHWSARGEVNGSMPRLLGTFLLPLIMLALFGLWALLPKIDPLDKGYKSFRYVYDFFWILIEAFLAYVYAFTLFANLGRPVDMLSVVGPGLGVLFVALGALLPRVKRNWFFGMRTPWSLSSESVWEKTHEFGGKLFIIAGVLILVGAFASPGWSLAFIVWPVILAALTSVVYSYLAYAREKRG
jgi:uncharacterized membrane protein